MSFNRLAGIAGLAFAATAIAVLAISGTQPAPGAATDDIVAYLSSGDMTNDINALISVMGLLPLAVFVAGLLIPFQASDRRHGEGWATSILIGVVSLSASIAVHEGAFYGLLYRGASDLDAGVVPALWDMVYVTGASAAFSMAVIALSAAVPVLKHDVFPRWHGWLSMLIVALGVLALIDTVSPATAGMYSGMTFLGFTVVWITATSILLIRTPATEAVRTTEGDQPVS